MQGKLLFNYSHPVRIVGGSIDQIAPFIIGGDRVLVVTTPGFVRRGVVERLKQALIGKMIDVWDGVKPNPDIYDIDVAASTLQKNSFDSVVGLGGGSALDAAKVLATLLANSEPPKLTQYFRDKVVAKLDRRLPLVAIPTTSGTGAEVTPFATVWDHSNHQKYSLAGDCVYPDIAWLDPSLTLTLGEEDTLYPALDTISHALESLWNKNATPISRAHAFQSLSLSSFALPRLQNEPKCLDSRKNLQIASLLAGLAISETRTAVAHSVSYPLTSKFGVPHGLACSFTLVYILSQVRHKISKNPLEIQILENVLSLLQSLKIGQMLKSYGNNVEMELAINEGGNSDRLGNFFIEIDNDFIKKMLRYSL